MTYYTYKFPSYKIGGLFVFSRDSYNNLPWLRIYSEHSYQKHSNWLEVAKGKATRGFSEWWRIALKGEREDARLVQRKKEWINGGQLEYW